MKIKQLPEDFQVEEIPSVAAGQGAFAFYRLEKRGWTTPDALALLRRRWNIEPRRLSYGGLKDRHALTVQYLTIFHGPRRGLNQQSVRVEYLGQVGAPYGSQDIRCNRFRLAIRSLATESRPALELDLARLGNEGVPNYFDDQRFGSVSGPGDEFVARHLVRGEFEAALRQALVAPYEFDRAAQKEEKKLLAEQWGDWAALKEKLPRSHTRSLVDYLRVHPTDFRGAMARMRPEMRTLYLSAYQSYLWNRLLAAWLHEHCPAERLRMVPLRLGPVPFPAGLDAAQRGTLAALILPLPSARLKMAADDPRAALVQAVLVEEGLTLRDLQVRGVREMFFSRGERPALCVPGGLTHRFEADELNAGRDKLILAFELPRGAYATLIVKRLFVNSG